ncbi:MAG: SUMF1/EgtB/PvdO family nonheme iron enzyme [Kiritimatiellia bacterium]
MKASLGVIGWLICALTFPLAGCGGRQCSPMPPMSRPPLPRTFTQTVEVFQVTFDMVLVPGDETKGIKTLYVGKHEVDSVFFFLWAQTFDIKDYVQAAHLRAKQLRPSLVYTHETYHGPRTDDPAAGMSRMSAQLFCEWLAEQTGRKYRLPTEREWEHAFGGRSFYSPEEACEYAVFEANSTIERKVEAPAPLKPKPGKKPCWIYAFMGLGEPATPVPSVPPVPLIIRDTRRPGSLAPNEYGLFDMAGNVAEWVMDTGEARVVRGGHYLSPLEEIGLPGRLVEDQLVWNLNFFASPTSKWWYVDAPWTGFRLVCEP